MQTVDHGGQPVTSWSLWWDAASRRVTLLDYVTFVHSYFVSLLTLTMFFFN